MLDFICMGPVDLTGARRKRQNYKMKNSLSTVGLEPSTLRFKVWCSTDWASRTWWMLSISFKWPYYIHVLQIPMFTLLHMYQNDELERNLSCKCTVLCYILEYTYILQITKRRIDPVLAFNVRLPDLVECLAVFACWKQAKDLFDSLLFVQHLYIIFQYVTQNSTFTRQNTLYFIILVIIIMYTLVSGVHVCNKVI